MKPPSFAPWWTLFLVLGGCHTSPASPATHTVHTPQLAGVATKLARACYFKADAPACLVLAGLPSAGLPSAGKPDEGRLVARAVELSRAACDRGEAEGCALVGLLVEASAPSDPELERRVTEWLTRGCRGGAAHVCELAAARYEHGRGAAVDPNYATELYARGCDANEGESCERLGWLLLSAGADPQRTALAYARGCEAGVARSCLSRGQMNGPGRELPEDLAEAARWFERACAGDAATCYYLGELYRAGAGVQAAPARARALFERACKAGEARACDQATRISGLAGGPRNVGPF